MVAFVDFRQRVDIAARSGNRFLNVGTVGEQLLRLRALALDQVVQRQEHALRAVDHFLRRGDVHAEDDVRIVFAGEHEVQLLLHALLRNDFPFDMNVRFLFVPFGELVGGEILDERVAAHHDLKRHFFLGDRISAGLGQQAAFRACAPCRCRGRRGGLASFVFGAGASGQHRRQ